MKEERSTISEGEALVEEQDRYEEALKKVEEQNGEIRALVRLREHIDVELKRIAGEALDHANWMGTQGWRIEGGLWSFKLPKSGGLENG